MADLRSFSFGGGVQSMAAMVLAARGEINFRTFLFANVGDDSELPATLAYVQQYAQPYADAHGLELTTLSRVMVRSGEHRTLYSEITRPGSKALKIPLRGKNGAKMTRSCTVDYKLRVIGQELKRRGASKDNPATVGIGITLDEIQRANDSNRMPYERIVYPLLELGLRRIDCERIIRDAGLPIPDKSSCWFCPLRGREGWHEMRRNDPEQFRRAVEFERVINERQKVLGRRPLFLSNGGQPLDKAIPAGVDLLPFFDPHDDGCDSGWCMT